jgi:lysyl-tRNA synthetase class II
VANKEADDEEAMYFGAEFIRALEYGVGTDRLVM